MGYGHSSGDASAAPQTIEQALKLLTAPPPWRRQLEPVYEGLAAIKGPIDWPAPDSEIEDWIFAASAVIFVEPTQSERARQALRQTLGVIGRIFDFGSVKILGTGEGGFEALRTIADPMKLRNSIITSST